MLPLITGFARAAGMIGRASAKSAKMGARAAYHRRNITDDDGNVMMGRDKSGKYKIDSESVIFGIGSKNRAALRAVGGKVGKGVGNQLTGNTLIGKSFAAVGDMALGQKPKWQRNEDAVARRQAKKVLKKNKIDRSKYSGYEDLVDSIKFDNAMGTDFTSNQFSLKSKGLLNGGKGFKSSGIHGFGSSGFSNDLGGGSHGGGKGLIAAGAAGGIAKVALVGSEGVDSIVNANMQTMGAVETTGGMIVDNLSGTSKLLQGQGGKFKDGNPGGKSLVVQEMKRAQEKLEAIDRSQSKLATSNSVDNDQQLKQLKSIKMNTSPELKSGKNEMMVITIREGHQLSKINNVLTETSNKYLAFIAKRLGLKPEEKKARRGKALLGMAALGAVGYGGSKLEKTMPEVHKKITEFMDWGKQKMSPIMEMLDSKIRPLFNAMSGMWKSFKESKFFQTMSAFFGEYVNSINKFFGSELFTKVVNFFKLVASDIAAFFNSDVFQSLISVVKTFGGVIASASKALFSLVKVLYKWVIKPLGWVFGKLLKIVNWALEPILNGIKKAFDGMSGVLEMFDAFMSSATEFFVNMWDWFRNSWLGKKLGLEDTLDLSQFENQASEQAKTNDYLKTISDSQVRALDELQLSNKQREQIHRRNQEIARQEAQKELEARREQMGVAKEQVDINRKVLSTIDSVNRNQIDTLSLTQAQIDKAQRDANKDKETMVSAISEKVLAIATQNNPESMTGKDFVNNEAKVKYRNDYLETLGGQLKDNLDVLTDVGLTKTDKQGNYIINFDKNDFNDWWGGNSDKSTFLRALGGGDSFESMMKGRMRLGNDEGAVYNRANDDMVDTLVEWAKGDDTRAESARKALTRMAEYTNNKTVEYSNMEEEKRKEKEREAKLKQEEANKAIVGNVNSGILNNLQVESNKKSQELISGMVKSFENLGKEDFLSMYGQDAYEKIKDKVESQQQLKAASNNIKDGVVSAVDLSKETLHKVGDETNEKLDKIYEYIKSDEFLANGGTGSDDGSFSVGGSSGGGGNVPQVEGDGSLGSYVKQFESGSQGSAAIGYDSTGGTSYGKYQIASKTGTMKEFLNFVKDKDPEVYQRLIAAGNPNTGGRKGAFVDAWKALAKEGKIQGVERDFIKKTHYDVAYSGLDSDVQEKINGSRALQEALWSTSVQHGGGGARGIFSKTYSKGMSDEDYIKAIYAERRTRFGSSTAKTRQSVMNRFDRELPVILGIKNAKANDVSIDKGVDPTIGSSSNEQFDLGVGEYDVSGEMINASKRAEMAKISAQSKPVIVPIQPSAGNDGNNKQAVNNTREIANVVPETDESIHFQNDIPSQLAMTIMSKSFA